MVFGGDGVVAPMGWDQVSIPARARAPGRLAAFEAIGGAVDFVLQGNLVEHTKFMFRPPAGLVRHFRFPQVVVRPSGISPRIPSEGLPAVGLEGRADEARGGHFPEGIPEGACQVRQLDYVASLDGLEPDRGAVEPKPIAQQGAR